MFRPDFSTPVHFAQIAFRGRFLPLRERFLHFVIRREAPPDASLIIFRFALFFASSLAGCLKHINHQDRRRVSSAVLSVCFLCFAKSKQDKIPLEMGPNPFHPAAPEPQNFTALLNPFFSREKMLHRKKMSFFFAFARQRRVREGPFAGDKGQMRFIEKKPGS